MAIYKGQLAALGHTHIAPQLEHMLAQEQAHLKTFDHLLNEHKARTSLLGPKAAMACTAAVEEIIVDHYQGQTKALTVRKPLIPERQICLDFLCLQV